MQSINRFGIGIGSVIALTYAGAAPIQAQSQPAPADLVVEINVKDQQGFKEYADKATKTVEQYGGEFITLGGNIKTIEGPEPNGTFVIIKFDSTGDAQKWLNSPEYSAVKGIRHRTANSRQYLVEGLPAK